MNDHQDYIPSADRRSQSAPSQENAAQPTARRRRTQAQEMGVTPETALEDTVVREQRPLIAKGSRAQRRAAPPDDAREGGYAPLPAPETYRDPLAYEEAYEGDSYEPAGEAEPPQKRNWLRWAIVIALLLALLAGATYIGTQHPDLVGSVVNAARGLLSGATASPEPTAEPTPVPTPEVTAKEMAKVLALQADPPVQPLLDQAIFFEVLTTTQTERVRIVDGNGKVLVESTPESGYIDSEFGRSWRLGVFFIDPYKGEVEANPGTATEWNEADSYTTLIEAGSVAQADPPEVYPEDPVTPVDDTAIAPVSTTPAAVVSPVPVSVTGLAYSGATELSAFSRETPISFADAAEYAGANGMKGVLAYRGSNMRQNAAFGAVAPMSETLVSLWNAPVGSASGVENRVSAQPLIVQWHQDIREMMTQLTAAKREKPELREVIFPSGDSAVYFLDLDDGAETRQPLQNIDTSGKLGAAAVYPRGYPVMAVGAGAPGEAATETSSYLEVYNLFTGERDYGVRNQRAEAVSTDLSIVSSPLFDTQTGVILAAGGNGLLYSMTIRASIDQAQAAMELGADLETYAAQAPGDDAAVDSALAAYGEYAYYATRGGVLQAVNVNTLTTAWALDLGIGVSAAVALDLEAGQAAPTLYAATVADASGTSCLHRIDSATGTVQWTVPLLGSASASLLIGTGDEIGAFLYAAATTGAQTFLYALDKQTGEIAWQQEFEAAEAAAPLALYGDPAVQGGAWVAQGAGTGLHLLDGLTGELRSTLELGAAVIGSPAAYEDRILIATADGMLHCAQIQ